MKQWLMVILLLQSFVLWADVNGEIAKELHRHGGIATFDLTVTNELGEPIEGVVGNAGFWYFGKDSSAQDVSDEAGRLVLSNRASTDGRWAIEKDGFYPTRGYAYFEAPDAPFGFFERRRWKPVVQEVVLKTKRNPIPMYSKQYRGKLPVVNQPLGFDLRLVDWVPPYGKGEVADMLVTVAAEEEPYGPRTRLKVTEVILEWPGAYNGAQVCDADIWSRFLSAYQVDMCRPFVGQLVLPSRGSRYKWLDHQKYLVFRVRSEVSATGKLSQCHYGKIYPSINVTPEEFAINLIFFNPTPNDTNLEFDPKHNLSPFSCYQEETMLNRGYP